MKVCQDSLRRVGDGRTEDLFFFVIFLPFYTVVVEVFQTALYIKQEVFKLV